MVGELLFFIQNLFNDVYSRIVKSIYLPSIKYVAGVAYVVMYAFLVGLPLATIPGGRLPINCFGKLFKNLSYFRWAPACEIFQLNWRAYCLPWFTTSHTCSMARLKDSSD